MSKRILVTGAAGYIGFHTVKELINQGHNIIGIDNINSYYEVKFKEARLRSIKSHQKISKGKWKFIKCDLCNDNKLTRIFNKFKPEIVINLAAQAGVRYSIENPKAYIDSNIVGFSNILECCKIHKIEHLIYASSSSVYGGNKDIPFSEDNGVNHPVSFYAATKRANELMAHAYSHLHKLPTTGLRFFTVYGPWGRPDMSYFIFTSKILKGEKIKIFNKGKMMRDFTYIDDVVKSIVNITQKIPSGIEEFNHITPTPAKSWCPFQIFNVGNSSPVELMSFIKIIENILGVKAKKDFLPMQQGDVEKTYAEINLIKKFIEFNPKTSLEEGLNEFIIWYKKYYKIL